MKKNYLIYTGLFVLFFFFVACEKKSNIYAFLDVNITVENKEEIKLSEEVLSYWEEYSQKNFSVTYDKELAYQRFIYDLEWYMTFLNGNRENYKVYYLGSQIKNEKAIVRLKLMFGENELIKEDNWYKINDQWFHYFNDSVLPKPTY